MLQESQPSINRLEKAIVDKNYEVACSELLKILEKIDANFGDINEIEFDFPEQISDLLEKRTQYFCTRIANAVTNLFIDPKNFNKILFTKNLVLYLASKSWILPN
ncbi:hypothetical protein [Haemophilus aegyptius]|uniref:hypothetical protein n=1 Tax=Haemophilus aegyptius TaxID=197575 RepID=UPI000E02A9B0|nr:hypothetical protein [Haemophilus aegyptius]STO62169.1 hmw2c, glycosyltransferase involved in glycosylation of hmw1a and hmw2a [Haemophilus aegyptius]